VLALEASREPPSPEEYRSEAYRCGRIGGRFAEVGCCFTENPSLPRWPDASERLDYYRGHRAGSEARNAAMGGWEEQVRERGSPAAEEVSEMGAREQKPNHLWAC
jgi:hypothetical protein